MKTKILILITSLTALLTATSFAGHEHDEIVDILMHGRTNVNLEKVIDKVEEVSKGSVIEIRFERMDKLFSFKQAPFVFMVETIGPDGVMEYQLNPTDLEILSKKKDFFSRFKSKKKIDELSINLKEAILKAEQFSGGKAIRAELESMDDIFAYQVQVIKKSEITKILVDPFNGSVYQFSQKEHDEH